MTSAHHEEVGRRVGAAGAGDSNNSRGPGRSGGRGSPGRRLSPKRPPYSGSRVSGSPASASYMEDPQGQKTKDVRLSY